MYIYKYIDDYIKKKTLFDKYSKCEHFMWNKKKSDIFGNPHQLSYGSF